MSNRNVIIEEIRAALEGDARIAHAAEVAVAEREGMVTLRGTVRSPHQSRTAVEIAKSVRGVRAVEDGLRIDPRDRSRDNEIRGAALQALADDGVPARVDVDVSNGWATLKGEVKRQDESDAAFAGVSGISGVGGVTNRIVVVSAGLDG
jgi:osmotically-inducible protein OsmY